MAENEQKLIEARSLNELAFCPRLYYLMYVQGLFLENADTVTGSYIHERRDDSISEIEGLSGIHLDKMVLHSEKSGICGKFDILRGDDDGIIPIEAKNSTKPDREISVNFFGVDIKTSMWANDFLQIAAQMVLLNDNGFKCSKGKVYYKQSNRMVDIEFDDTVRCVVEKAVAEAKKLAHEGIPKPLLDSPKCVRCSLNELCLPDEYYKLEKKIQEPRRLFPGRDDAGIVHIVTPGTRIGKEGDNITIALPEGLKDKIPIKDISHISINGTSQISTQALLALVKENASVSYISSNGWLEAVVSSPLDKNVFLRQKQFTMFGDETVALSFAKAVVASKIENQRTFLRRNCECDIKKELNELKVCVKKTKEAKERSELLGYEGYAANIYWQYYPKLIKNKAFEMKDRNKRPPRDEVNAMLSYGYTLLVRDLYTAAINKGFDPMFGFYHSIVPGRPAFALDMMEPYRTLIVDSIVLRMINENSVSKGDFLLHSGGVYMQDTAKKKLIEYYEKRVDEMITHPVMGYRLSYRRMFNLEMIMLAKKINGETNSFAPLTTR